MWSDETWKLHAVVARSTCPSQNVQNTPTSDHFWKLWCRKSARRRSAKHIWKSKCTKHLSDGARLEVEMSKKCTRPWRETHFEVKMLKTVHVRTTFGRSDVVSRGRRPRWRNVSWHRMEAPWTEGRQCLSKSRDMNLTGPDAKQTRSTPMCFAPRKSECSAGNHKVSNNSLLLGMKLIAHCWITMDCWLAQVKSQQTRKLWELKTPGLGSWTLRTYLPPRIYLLMNLLYSIRFYLFLSTLSCFILSYFSWSCLSYVMLYYLILGHLTAVCFILICVILFYLM